MQTEPFLQAWSTKPSYHPGAMKIPQDLRLQGHVKTWPQFLFVIGHLTYVKFGGHTDFPYLPLCQTINEIKAGSSCAVRLLRQRIIIKKALARAPILKVLIFDNALSQGPHLLHLSHQYVVLVACYN